MKDLFGLKAQGTSFGGELRAGVTTFLTMSYILFINPSILSTAIPLPGATGMAQLLSATALAAAFGSLMMGLIARYPFALAPGMGLNAYFAYTVVGQQQIPWQTALGAVFLSGLLFLLLSVTGLRSLLIEALPRPLRRATTAGIGVFLAFIGLKNAGLILGHPATLVSLGDLSGAAPLLFFGGLLLTALALSLKLRGSILLGVILVTALAILFEAPVYQGGVFGGFPEELIQTPVWPSDLFLAADLEGAMGLGLLGIIFIFFFVDLFDTAGTLIGLSEKAGFCDQQGRLPRSAQAFTADALATSVGALLGSSTTTSYIESAAGIEEGGRTGLTAIVVALLFLLSLFLWPLAGAVPAVATAPALVIVGSMMLGRLKQIDWDDLLTALPSFLTIIVMPLTFSIANGISLGILSWTSLHLLRGRRVHPLMVLLSLALLARYAWLGGA